MSHRPLSASVVLAVVTGLAGITLASSGAVDPIVGDRVASADVSRKTFKNGHLVESKHEDRGMSIDFMADGSVHSGDDSGTWKYHAGRYSANLSASATEHARTKTGDPNAKAVIRFFKMKLDAANEVHGRIKAKLRAKSSGVVQKVVIKGTFVTHPAGP